MLIILMKLDAIFQIIVLVYILEQEFGFFHYGKNQ